MKIIMEEKFMIERQAYPVIDNLDALRKAWMAGEKFKFLFFWGHTPKDPGAVDQSCFSQWFPAEFTEDGVVYSCAEQYMMAGKARLFHDQAALAKILAAKHPKEMKALGREVTPFDKEAWEAHCFELVKRGNQLKFSQNPEMLDYLKLTKNRILVEASPRDRIWGIGMGKANPDAQNPMNWRGRNLLGFALTSVREDYFG